MIELQGEFGVFNSIINHLLLEDHDDNTSVFTIEINDNERKLIAIKDGELLSHEEMHVLFPQSKTPEQHHLATAAREIESGIKLTHYTIRKMSDQVASTGTSWEVSKIINGGGGSTDCYKENISGEIENKEHVGDFLL